jgi:predicted DCC family thiol-disulfide oxidoreductase YuxK
MTLYQFWHRAFFARRSSVNLSLFRLALAWTIAAHMLPSFFQMADNYLSTAFKTQNPYCFPAPLLQLVAASPDAVVWAFVGLFSLSLAAFTLGWRSQLSCLLLTLSCYYFYALNNYHIGTLSFDILLVTLVLMCCTQDHGDFFSLDSLRAGKDRSYRRLRPYWIQRLLQLQLAVTFWGTALSKMTAGGNWLTGNPYYALMHYPSIGVVRDFPGRAWLAQHPMACYYLGIALIVFELVIPFLWFGRRTRTIGITLGIAFQVMLWATLHVPTIFLFLFPSLMLLFAAPELLVRWIDRQREAQGERGRAFLLYDGQCGFCLESVKRLRVMDLLSWLDPLDFHRQPDLPRLHALLTPERCRSEMVLIEPNGQLAGGFDAFARLTQRLPMLMPLFPFAHLPGARALGARVYRWIAAHRNLLHRDVVCASNQCGLPHTLPPSQN